MINDNRPNQIRKPKRSTFLSDYGVQLRDTLLTPYMIGCGENRLYLHLICQLFVCGLQSHVNRSKFARVVKGVDLRSTAGNCAWVRTPQLAILCF